jgi:hydroxymethylbilane synthase
MSSLIRIGTRGSKLALYQAELIQTKLKSLFPSLEFELVKIRTTGDQVKHARFGELGPGIFTREIEQALLQGNVDLAVHSAKDLATELPKGLQLGAVLEREDPRDCLVSGGKKKLSELSEGAKIGTSSLRRIAQLKRMRSDLVLCEMRGNIDTRIRKIEDGEFDGMVLACAGLKRLGLSNYVSEIFDEDRCLPQAGQGALAIQIRKEDMEIESLAAPLNHKLSYLRILAERSFLRRLQGGCQLPVGVATHIEGDTIVIKGGIFSWRGTQEVKDSVSGALLKGEALGGELAEKLLGQGGAQILKEIRDDKKG